VFLHFLKNLNFILFFLLQINIFFIFSDYFDVLISKIIFFKIKKNIVLIHFQVKITLKSNRNHTSKHAKLIFKIKEEDMFDFY